MILLIDNYDSFTYNVYQYIGSFYKDIKVVRNDMITIEEIRALNPKSIVVSPGPKAPKDAGICVEMIKELGKDFKILGICLGHQSIGEAYGSKITLAEEMFHGKQSDVTHNESDKLFKGVSKTFKAARYHSLVIDKENIADCLEVTAKCEDGTIMAIKHREYDVYGLQFHPESIYTDEGMKIIENFVNL